MLDAFLLVLLAIAAFRGYKVGFSRQGPVAILSIAGVYAGARTAALVQGLTTDPLAKIAFMLFIVITAGVLGMKLGESVARLIRLKIEQTSTRMLDDVGGALTSVATLLFAVWLGTTLLVLGPPSALQATIRESSISRSLNATFPPAATVFSRIDAFLTSDNNPLVLIGSQSNPSADAMLPDIHLFDNVLAQARDATVKIEGFGCGGIVDGSGFMIAKEYIVTNAHVVGGVKHPKVVDRQGTHNATLVWFDPKQDIAVLRTDRLRAEPLRFTTERVKENENILIIGYPRGGEQVSSPGIVMERVRAIGKDIYLKEAVIREVLALQTTVIQGNSGGPVINTKGAVVGVVFATSTTYNTIGYALDAISIKDSLNAATAAKTTLPTPPCSAKGF